MKNDPLSTLAPQMAASASPERFKQMGSITRQLHDTLTQLGVMPRLQIAAGSLPEARSRLNYIANKTGEAASKALNSVHNAKAEHASRPSFGTRAGAATRAAAPALAKTGTDERESF